MGTTSQDKLLYLLKSRGPLTTAELARKLGMTAPGARQHLAGLRAAGLVSYADRPAGPGRPKRIWRLTAAGHARFPDTHADLAAGLIEGIRRLFGPEGLSRLIDARQTEALSAYRRALDRHGELGRKLRVLARLRTAEGYMADVEAQADGSFLLIEKHCPICVAAKACQGFCRAEADTFRAALGPSTTVERQEHLLSGGRRCVYRIAEAVPA